MPRRRFLGLCGGVLGIASAAGASGLVTAGCSTSVAAPAPGPPSWASVRHRYDADRQLYNATAANLGRWRAARDRAAAGGGSAHVSALLDSITYGVGDPGISRPAWQHSWPGRLRRRFDERYSPAGSGVVVPWNVQSPEDDPRWTFAGTGIAPLGLHGRACRTVRGSADDSSFIEFTAECDTFVVHHLGITPAARFLVDGRIPPTAEVRARTPGSAGPIVTTVPAGPFGAHTLRVLAPRTDPGALAMLVGVEAARGGGGQGVRVSNLALYGLGMGAVVLDDPAGRLGMPLTFDAMRADLVVLLVTGNDYQGHTPVDRFTEYVRTAARRTRAAGGDVLLATAPAPDPATIPPDRRRDPPLEEYYGAVYAVADTEDAPVLDLAARWGPHARAAARGFTDDALHPNDDGSEDIARAVDAALMSV